MAANDESFIGWIQLHERAWGVEKYKNRPTMHDMLHAPVLAFWYPTKATNQRFTATVHESVKALNEYASVMLVHVKTRPPTHRLARVFVDQRRMRIRGVRLLLESVDVW